MLKLRDIMTRDVVAFDVETGLVDAIEILAERHISGAPVMKGDRIVGVLSSSDILEFVATNPSALADYGDSDSGGRNALAGHTVEEAMSGGPPCALTPDAPIQAAADLMRQANVHRVFITEHDRLVGVISSLDVTRALAEHKIANRTFVFPGRTRTD
jgi:CBS domain-containing protein